MSRLRAMMYGMSFLFLSAHPLFSQVEKNEHRSGMQTIVRHFNAGSYDSIFLTFSPEMKTALPLEKTIQFFTGLKMQAGSIQHYQFLQYENGSVATYKTTFDRMVLKTNLRTNAEGNFTSLLLRPYVDTPTMERNVTKLQLPFKEEWTVFWGGDTKEQNYHVETPAQKNAFDMVVIDNLGKSFKTTGATNEDYYAFGKELFAPCNGEVVLVVDGIKDNKPGVLNPIYIPGNTVVIKTAANEYLFFAHFKKHSIQVKEGQKVVQGQLLGLCGNSGNSSEPHLHFHIQNTEELTTGTGVKCYFEKMSVNGKVMSDYSPVKGDKIKRE